MPVVGSCNTKELLKIRPYTVGWVDFHKNVKITTTKKLENTITQWDKDRRKAFVDRCSI